MRHYFVLTTSVLNYSEAQEKIDEEDEMAEKQEDVSIMLIASAMYRTRISTTWKYL